MDSNSNMFSNRSSIDWGDTHPYHPSAEQKLITIPVISPTVPQGASTPGSSNNTEAHGVKLAIPRITAPQHKQTMTGISFSWTLAEIEKLVALRAQGLRFYDIAKQLPGRTERGCNSFYLKYSKNQASALNFLDEELQVLKEDDLDEDSPELVNEVPKIASQPPEMAPKVVSSKSMGCVLNNNREENREILPPIPIVPRPWTGLEDQALLRMLSKGFTFAELHARFPDRSLGDCHRRYRFYYDRLKN